MFPLLTLIVSYKSSFQESWKDTFNVGQFTVQDRGAFHHENAKVRNHENSSHWPICLSFALSYFRVFVMKQEKRPIDHKPMIFCNLCVVILAALHNRVKAGCCRFADPGHPLDGEVLRPPIPSRRRQRAMTTATTLARFAISAGAYCRNLQPRSARPEAIRRESRNFVSWSPLPPGEG